MLTAVRDRIGGFRRPEISTPSFFAVGVVVLGLLLLRGFGGIVLFLAIFVPCALAVHRRPQVGLLVLSALLPFDGLLIIANLPGFANGWKEAFLGALFVLTFMCPPEARAPEHRQRPGWLPAVYGLMAIGFVSALVVGGVTALTGLRISFFNILAVAVLWRCPLNRRERDRFVTIFIVVAFITSLVGLWQQTVGHAQLASMGYQYNETIRFTSGFRLRSFSTFNQPFPFGFYLMLAILIATPFSIADPKRLRSRLYILSLPVISVALVFTYVRAAWLGLGLGLLYLAFHRYKVMVYGIPLALVAFLFLPGGTSFTQAAFQSESFNARTTSWSQKYHVLLDNPLGTGIGTTGAAAATSVKLRGVNQATFQPDNAYLKVAFELGVLGLWLFVLLLVAAFREGRSVERRVGDPERHFAAGWCAQVLAIAAAATVSTYFEMIPMDALFWITLGIVSTMAPIELPTRTVGQLEGSERAAFASTAS